MATGYSLDALVQEHYIKSPTWLGGTKLNELYGFDKVGVYSQAGNTQATVENNYPAGAQAGTLEVLPHNANVVGNCLQRYTNFANKRMWLRSQSGTTSDYDQWVEMVSMNNVFSAIYPIGIVLQFDNATNPNNSFTGTVWEQITDGRAARAATSATAGTSDGQIGSVAGSDSVSIAVDNLPSHTHDMRSHTHFIGSHYHIMNHTHSINHDHGAVNTSSAGAHTHSVSGTAESAGAHTHSVKQGVATSNTSTGGTGGDNMQNSNTGSAGAHTHTVSGTAASAGAHTHSVDLPNFTGTSGGPSVTGTSGTELTTNGPSNNTSDATGGGNNLDVRNSSHYYAFWKRVA